MTEDGNQPSNEWYGYCIDRLRDGQSGDWAARQVDGWSDIWTGRQIHWRTHGQSKLTRLNTFTGVNKRNVKRCKSPHVILYCEVAHSCVLHPHGIYIPCELILFVKWYTSCTLHEQRVVISTHICHMTHRRVNLRHRSKFRYKIDDCGFNGIWCFDISDLLQSHPQPSHGQL